MTTSPLNRVIQHILADLGTQERGATDGELLARFLRGRDDAALAALVRRHAPMVWGVCRRLLNHHDAEDAFQATFLVLVHKAADVPGQAVAGWLHGVARQTAVRLRATAAKRGRRETQVMTMPEPTMAEVRDDDLQVALDEELGRLPDHYRGVVVLCDLGGMTRKEAARQLGIPEGSVASRLARARALLAKRLARRGVVLSGSSVAEVLSAGSASASAPPALVASTIRAASLLAAGRAAGVVSAQVAALTEGVVRAMFHAKLRTVTCVIVLTILVGLGAGVLVSGGGHLPAAGATTAPSGQPAALVLGETDMGNKPAEAALTPGEEPTQEPGEKPADKPAAKTHTIRGKVVDDATGKPVREFTVRAEKFDPADPSFDPADPRKAFWGLREERPGGADGSFSTTVQWSEGWTARIVADGYLSQPVLTSAPPADKDEIEVTIRLQRPPKNVRGVVLDHAGKPVAGAAVFAIGPNGLNLSAGAAWSRGWPGENRKDKDATPVMTDEQGRFEVSTVGAKVLGVSHSRLDAWAAALPANGEVTIRLPKPARVEIKVDIEGAGKECTIYYKNLSDVPMPESGLVQISRWVSIPNPGSLVLDAFPPGKYQLYRCGAGGRILDQHIFDLKVGETKTIDYLRNTGARVRGKVTWPADLKPEGITVSIQGEESFKEPLGHQWQRTYTSLHTSEDGTFLTERIPPGTYQLLAYAFEPVPPERLMLTGIRPATIYAEPRRIVVPADGELKVEDLVLKAMKPKDAGPPPAQPNQQPGTGYESGFGGGLAHPASEAKPAGKTDRERMVGNWYITNDDSMRKGEMWVVTEDSILMHAKNLTPITHRYAHRLDAGKDPNQIDITVTHVNGSPIGVIKGLYVLDGDELRLCLAALGKDRPAAFPEKPAPGDMLVLHRDPPTMTKEEKLRVLIDKVLAAHGGEDKLNKLQFTMTVKHSNGYTNQYFVQPPKNFRWEQQHRDQTGKMIVILFPEGRRWWTKEPNEAAKEFIPLGVEPRVEYWLDYVKFFGPRQMLRLKDADHKVALLDEEAKIGDRAAVGVEVTGPRFTLFKGKMYFDKETHLLLKGPGADVREATFSDYKTFDGIPIAQKGDDGYFMPQVTDFRVVDKFDAKLFEQP